MTLQADWERDFRPLFCEGTFDLFVDGIVNGYEHHPVREANLDAAATTPPFQAVQEAVGAFLREYGSVHRGSGYRSLASTRKYEEARERIGRFLGATEDQYVVFTKNTTEAVNHAASLLAPVPGAVLVSDIEHSSNLLPWIRAGNARQFATDADDHTIDYPALVQELAKGDVKLLAVTGSPNVTGYKPNIRELAHLAHRSGAQIFVDACQLVPHEPLDASIVDFAALSGHKMYAPYGAGVLVGPKALFDEAEPYQLGGGNLAYITRGLEMKRLPTVRAHDPGTPNAVGAIAIAAAADVIESIGYDRIRKYEEDLVNGVYEGLSAIKGVRIHLPPCSDGHVIPFDIKGFDHRLVAEILRRDYGIGVRAGSFCTYELMRRIKGVTSEQDARIAQEVSQGITRNIPGTVRASFGLATSPEDGERLVSAVAYLARNPGLWTFVQDRRTGSWR